MFSIQIKSLATIHIQQVTAAYNSRGKGRQLRIASLYPDLIDQLENMAEAFEEPGKVRRAVKLKIS